MEDLNYFYMKDDDGVSVLRVRNTSTGGILEKALLHGSTEERIAEICEGVGELEQWVWYDLYTEWVERRDLLTARAEESVPRTKGRRTGPRDRYTNMDAEEILSHIPVPPIRPEIRTGEMVFMEYARSIFVSTRTRKVNHLLVTIDELTFDANEDAQNRMCRAAFGMDEVETITWTLHDNSTAEVTRQQLRNALREAGKLTTAVWHQ